MAENNKNAMAGSAPAKPKPADPVAAKPAAPGTAKPAAPGTAKPAASTGGVYKPPVERAPSNPYKDSRVSDLGAWFSERFYV
ncbi:MAG: cytochrome B, partial [Chlorobiaceae bacterium]|nr:cytochrome B [Chlorobiaceae bacterium]